MKLPPDCIWFALFAGLRSIAVMTARRTPQFDLTPKYLGILGFCCLPLALQQASAEDWEFEVVPYLWVAGIDGDLTVEGRDFSSSADFEDIIDQTKFGASAIFGARRDNWVSFVQLDYLALENDDISTRRSREDIHLEFDSLLAAATTGYRFPVGQSHSVDLMAGVRYAGMDATVDAKRTGDSNANRDIYDAIVMVRPRFQISENWQIMPSFSVGTGDSDLSWEVFPEIIYQGSEFTFRFGYRNLNYDSDKGNSEIDISMRGLLLGAGFVF